MNGGGGPYPSIITETGYGDGVYLLRRRAFDQPCQSAQIAPSALMFLPESAQAEQDHTSPQAKTPEAFDL